MSDDDERMDTYSDDDGFGDDSDSGASDAADAELEQAARPDQRISVEAAKSEEEDEEEEEDDDEDDEDDRLAKEEYKAIVSKNKQRSKSKKKRPSKSKKFTVKVLSIKHDRRVVNKKNMSKHMLEKTERVMGCSIEDLKKRREEDPDEDCELDDEALRAWVGIMEETTKEKGAWIAKHAVERYPKDPMGALEQVDARDCHAAFSSGESNTLRFVARTMLCLSKEDAKMLIDKTDANVYKHAKALVQAGGEIPAVAREAPKPQKKTKTKKAKERSTPRQQEEAPKPAAAASEPVSKVHIVVTSSACTNDHMSRRECVRAWIKFAGKAGATVNTCDWGSALGHCELWDEQDTVVVVTDDTYPVCSVDEFHSRVRNRTVIRADATLSAELEAAQPEFHQSLGMGKRIVSGEPCYALPQALFFDVLNRMNRAHLDPNPRVSVDTAKLFKRMRIGWDSFHVHSLVNAMYGGDDCLTDADIVVPFNPDTGNVGEHLQNHTFCVAVRFVGPVAPGFAQSVAWAHE